MLTAAVWCWWAFEVSKTVDLSSPHIERTIDDWVVHFVKMIWLSACAMLLTSYINR